MNSGESASTQPLGRRERNKLRVKEGLYSSALALFTEQGYDRTSIDDIAERADVARGTFFNYFQRKEDLISAWGEKRRQKLRACVEEAQPAGSGAVPRLRRCMSILGTINESERELTAAMLTAWVKAGRPLTEEPYVGQIFAEIIADGCRQGELRPDLAPVQVGNFLRDIYFGILYRWSQRSPIAEYGTLDDELQTALRTLLDGVAVPH